MSDSDAALVSVILPVFNRWQLCRRALESLAAQRHRPIEVIIVDDGSTDETQQQIESSLKDLGRLKIASRFVRQPNRGAPSARNHGLSLAEGEFIQFLDSDNSLAPGKIEAQLAGLRAQKTEFAYGPWMHRRPGQSDVWQQVEPLSADPEVVLERHIRGWFCPPTVYLWTREAVERVGDWDESLAADQDGDFTMRALLRGCKPCFIGSPTATFNAHPGDRISVGASIKHLDSRLRVANKIRDELALDGRLERFRFALADRYYTIEELAVIDCPDVRRQARTARRAICPSYGPRKASLRYEVFRELFGLKAAQFAVRVKAKMFR